MILAIIAAWMAYKRAKEFNRNGILWVFITAGAFIGTQFLVSLGAGFVIGLGIGFQGWADDTYEKLSLLITAAAIIASVVVTMLILRFLNRVPEEPAFAAPPEPPKFN